MSAMETDMCFTAMAPPSPPRKLQSSRAPVCSRNTVSYCIGAGYLMLLATAAVLCIHVSLKILDAASEAQDIIVKARTVFSLLYSFACNGSAQLLSDEDCTLLATVA